VKLILAFNFKEDRLALMQEVTFLYCSECHRVIIGAGTVLEVWNKSHTVFAVCGTAMYLSHRDIVIER